MSSYICWSLRLQAVNFHLDLLNMYLLSQNRGLQSQRKSEDTQDSRLQPPTAAATRQDYSLPGGSEGRCQKVSEDHRPESLLDQRAREGRVKIAWRGGWIVCQGIIAQGFLCLGFSTGAPSSSWSCCSTTLFNYLFVQDSMPESLFRETEASNFRAN